MSNNIIRVHLGESEAVMLRWENLWTEAHAKGERLTDGQRDEFKRSLCHEVCQDLLAREAKPFVSSDQFWLLVHKKAAEKWLGHAEADKLSKEWAEKGQIMFHGDVCGKAAYSQQYVEYWVQAKNRPMSKKREGEEKIEKDDEKRQRFLANSLGAGHGSRPGTIFGQQNKWAMSVDGRAARVGDATPSWENSADLETVIAAMQMIIPGERNKDNWTIESHVPQRGWHWMFGQDWEEIGETLRSTARQLGCYMSNGNATPIFHLQLRLGGYVRDTREWMGTVRLSWDTTLVVEDSHFVQSQLYRAAAFVTTYFRTAQAASKQKTKFPRMDRCVHWAVAQFADLELPLAYDFNATVIINNKWAAAHKEHEHELGWQLLDYLDEGMLEGIRSHVDNMDTITEKMDWLVLWVERGQCSFYPVQGADKRDHRLRWALPITRDVADEFYQAKFNELRSAVQDEPVHVKEKLTRAFVDEVCSFVLGATPWTTPWTSILPAKERWVKATGWFVKWSDVPGFHNAMTRGNSQASDAHINAVDRVQEEL